MHQHLFLRNYSVPMIKINYISDSEPHGTLIRESKFVDSSGYPYTKCPCWGHKVDRTFVVPSPIDYTFSVGGDPVFGLDPNILQYNEEDLDLDNPVLHLDSPHFLFWTHDSNVWLEAIDHPMTSLVNNLIVVSGWVQLSTWPVMNGLGFVIVDKSKPVVIKKGDPLMRITFHSPDLNSKVELEQITENTEEILNTYHTKRDESVSNGTWKDRLFAKGKDSKCPFARIIY